MPRLTDCTIICICGDIGAGKDTAADALVKIGYEKLVIADQLKHVVSEAFPWVPREHFFGSQEDKNETLFVSPRDGTKWTGRKILEKVGEDFRQIYQDVWLTNTVNHISDAVVAHKWVIPGIRHLNELHLFRAAGAQVWEVRKLDSTPERTGHVSDEAWRDYPKDKILMAFHGDVKGLQKQAVEAAREYEKIRRLFS